MCTCTLCGETKVFAEFGFRDTSTGRRHKACKVCVAAYGRQHYVANRPAYISRNNRLSRSRTLALKPRIWEYLAEHPCVECGLADALVLEFDHVDPAKKRKTINKLVRQAYSWSAIQAEIENCEVRCANCHRRRTAAQFGWAKQGFSLPGFELLPPSATGTLPRSPPRNRRRSAPRAPVVLPPGSRFCRTCGHVKAEELFPYRQKASAARHSICGQCSNSYRRDHYRMNKDDYIRRNAVLQRIRRLVWQRRLWEYVLAHPCVDCAERDPLVLEFDHVDRTTKVSTLCTMATRGYAWTTVLAELAKCEVRCANCHRRRTAAQFDWPKLSMAANASID